MSIEQFYNNALDILEEIYNSTSSVLKISHMELASLKNRFIREINNMVGTIQGLEKMNIFISPTSCSAEAHYDYALENLRHLFDLVFTKNSIFNTKDSKQFSTARCDHTGALPTHHVQE